MPTLRATLAGDENGATAIEYAILAALIGVGLIGTLGLFGEELVGMLTSVGNDMSAATPTT